MRILNVIESTAHGGAEQVLLNVLPELQARGHICEIATLWPPDAPRKRVPGVPFVSVRSVQGDFERAGIRVHRLPWSYRRRWDMAGGAARVAALARATSCDVLHAHLLFSDFYVGLSRSFHPGPARFAWLQSTDFAWLNSSRSGRIAARTLPPILRRGFDGVAAVGTPVAEHYREHVPGLDVRTIPNAVTIPDVPSDPRRDQVLARWQASPNSFVLLMSARLVAGKNHHVLIEALSLLRERGMSPQLLLAGGGDLREELEKQVRDSGLQDQVIFCGHVEHGELQELLWAVDAFVLPSQNEGLPLSVAEAMAARRAVLATRVGGIPDLVREEETGLLVPPSDAPALAHGIERLMGDEALRQRLGHAARERVARHFSARAIAVQWEEFYTEIIERRRGHS